MIQKAYSGSKNNYIKINWYDVKLDHKMHKL